MNPVTQQPRHYNRNEIGGPIGFVFDLLFCAFVIVAALCMIVFAYVILLVDYFTGPARDLLNVLRHYGSHHGAAVEKRATA